MPVPVYRRNCEACPCLKTLVSRIDLCQDGDGQGGHSEMYVLKAGRAWTARDEHKCYLVCTDQLISKEERV